ncbi:MAG: nucleotidyltransferase domain-containing protein [Armatimonadota bacterium]
MHALETFKPEEQELLRQAVDVICSVAQQHGVDVVRIYLFGSRARGGAGKDSDWDFYVVIDKEVGFLQRQQMGSLIRRFLAKQKIDCDVLIQAEETVCRRRSDTGYLTYYVLKEGVPVYERRYGEKLDAQSR